METFSALLAMCAGRNSPVRLKINLILSYLILSYRWIPRTKASDAELWYFLWSVFNKRLSKQWWGWWFETPLRPLWHHRNVYHTHTHIHLPVKALLSLCAAVPDNRFHWNHDVNRPNRIILSSNTTLIHEIEILCVDFKRCFDHRCIYGCFGIIDTLASVNASFTFLFFISLYGLVLFIVTPG